MPIEVGGKLEGKVTGITKFGAFVELPGGITGLVHISEVANTYVTDIHQHLKVGDIVTVKVLAVKENKIALSIKKAVERPPFSSKQERREGFEEKLNKFLKESEDHQSGLRRHLDKKGKGR
ncbi:S1 RNA-binding domain-containing protein [Brevibacillus fulvus]|uniref:S1 RNA binding domain protein n=1 Tax=Brevibacillus fulvus TaxID=1125967 RepID=A0A938XX93_9BACL|nr:S1 RNA-binding domain-containing protein [Brevibacillus fulvus]MBM7592178.1 S1 RNA binding domain protein [Brevibacillus fulvus]